MVMDKSHMECGETKISIITSADGKETHVVIEGSSIATLFNFVILSRCVCRRLGLSPDLMARVLPRYIRNYEENGIFRETEVTW